MTRANHDRSINAALSSVRTLADQTFARAAGAPLVAGNAIRILKDGKANYPAWLEAIASAKNTIHFETYIIHRDEIDLQFAEALAEKARVDRPFGWISRENDSFGWNGGHYLTNSRPVPRTRLRHLFLQTLRSASGAQRLALGSWPGGSANATEAS
jgi:phosphatidylserine/phosphatidylglycerophosphate/cardiolipin synthase-like enzyme